MPNVWSCAYHPSIPASETCERCRRPICSSDVRMYYQWRRHGKYRRKIRRKYCIPCYAAVLQRDASLPSLLLDIVIIIFFAWIVFNIHPLFSVLVLVGAVWAVFYAKSKADKANQEAMLFLRSINQAQAQFPTVTTAASNTWGSSQGISTRGAPIRSKKMGSSANNQQEAMTVSDFVIVCFECGEKLLLTDKFCPSCGDSTQEELRSHYMRKFKSNS